MVQSTCDVSGHCCTKSLSSTWSTSVHSVLSPGQDVAMPLTGMMTVISLVLAQFDLEYTLCLIICTLYNVCGYRQP